MNFTGGAPPSDVTAEQTGVSTVLVTWTAPSPPPDGYQVQITRGTTTTTVNVAGTSHTFSVNNQYGVYSIQVRSPPSTHFQSNEAAPEPVEITVRGICKHILYIYGILYWLLLYGTKKMTVQPSCHKFLISYSSLHACSQILKGVGKNY